MPRARKKPQALSSDTGTAAAFNLALSNRTGGAGGVMAREGSKGNAEPVRALGGKTRAQIEQKLGPVPGARSGSLYVEEAVEGDANGRKRRRQIHPLDKMLEKGLVTKNQYRGGMALASAWEATFQSPSRSLADPMVDTSSQPDKAIQIQMQQREKYTWLSRELPRESTKLCHHVCCEARFLRDGFSRNGREVMLHLEQLRIALDCLADEV